MTNSFTSLSKFRKIAIILDLSIFRQKEGSYFQFVPTTFSFSPCMLVPLYVKRVKRDRNNKRNKFNQLITSISIVPMQYCYWIFMSKGLIYKLLSFSFLICLLRGLI
jgi:hypothetical protein